MRVVLVMAGLAGVVAVVDSRGTDLWMVAGGIATTCGAIYWAGRCGHPSPLALLPATVAHNGEARPARWYCDRCGREWPAVFERSTTPIQRFTGYDETKAVTAARRAEVLQDRRRSLAIERAGLHPAALAQDHVAPWRNKVAADDHLSVTRYH